MNKLLSIITVVFLTMSVGCRKPMLETPEAPIMIKGYLFGGDSIDDFYVERIATSREFQNEENVPLTEGTIKLTNGDETIELIADQNRPGYFINHDYFVIPNSTYTLEAEFDNHLITASCFVPEEPVLEEELTGITTLTVGGEADNSAVLFSFSWTEGSEYLIDLKPEEEDPEMLTFSNDIGKFDSFFSLPIKETSVSLFSEDFTYSGRHTLTIYSITSDYSDFIRYAPTSFDRNIYRAPNNIEGAYGVFAGLTGTQFELFIQESE